MNKAEITKALKNLNRMHEAEVRLALAVRRINKAWREWSKTNRIVSVPQAEFVEFALNGEIPLDGLVEGMIKEIRAMEAK